MATFESHFDIGQEVSFIPSSKQSRQLSITRDSGLGRIVAIRFTKAKVFYDVVDDYYGIIFQNLDSGFVEAVVRKAKMEEA